MDGNAGRGKSAGVFHGCITIFVIVFRLGWSAWRAVKGPGGVYHTRQRSRELDRGCMRRVYFVRKIYKIVGVLSRIICLKQALS